MVTLEEPGGWLRLLFAETRSSRGSIAILVGCLICGGASVQAQTGTIGAAIAGTVRDETGAPAAGAVITVTEASTNLTRTATADGRGGYLLAALPLGSYVLRVEHQRFQAVTRAGLAPGVRQVLVVDLTLTLAAAETVSVEREVTAGSLGGAAVASIIGERALAGLPTNGRDFVAFTLLTPGSRRSGFRPWARPSRRASRSPASGRDPTT